MEAFNMKAHLEGTDAQIGIDNTEVTRESKYFAVTNI